MTSHFVNTTKADLSKPFSNRKVSAAGFRRDRRQTFWRVGAGVGLLGGTFILFGAAFLTIFQFLYSENSHGSWLFALAFPLWIFGAHCFDKAEGIDKARRIEYCQQHGMTDD